MAINHLGRARQPGEVNFRQLFGTYFKSTHLKRASAKSLRGRVASTVVTMRGRLPLLIDFLRANKGKIRVFADVGAGNAHGAPISFEAKRALGEDSKVYAVDLLKLANVSPKDRRSKASIVPLLHSISRKALPFECDAIMFANVSQYMSQGDRRKAVRNIWMSLKVGGFLLGSYEGYEFILQKTERGFREITYEALSDIYYRNWPE